jgi:hypothetical protein
MGARLEPGEEAIRVDVLQITKDGAVPLTLGGVRRREVGDGIDWIDLDHSDEAGPAQD